MMGVLAVGLMFCGSYTSSTSGTVRIVVMNEIDLAVRHAQSFAACLDYTTT